MGRYVPGIPTFFAHLGDGVEGFGIGATAPVATRLSTGFFVAGEFAQGRIHFATLSIPRSVLGHDVALLHALDLHPA